MDRQAKGNQKRLIHSKHTECCEDGLVDLKNCSLIVPNKATLNLSVMPSVTQADFLPSAGFTFVLSTVQSPDVALPDPPPDRGIVLARL